ncbi:hypothetical protein [Schlesneria paludicola]|uniref:hypothetical protein n=1 Tax=Schlesneria paludicola TaxID=360056 RepID=UPI0002DF48DC|nr:hypothetical protein [Schlesneria paludicola]
MASQLNLEQLLRSTTEGKLTPHNMDCRPMAVAHWEFCSLTLNGSTEFTHQAAKRYGNHDRQSTANDSP